MTAAQSFMSGTRPSMLAVYATFIDVKSSLQRGSTVPFSALDADAIVLLSAVSNESLDEVRRSARGPLTEAEVSEYSKKIVDNLLNVFDLGERNKDALKRAALEGISLPPKSS